MIPLLLLLLASPCSTATLGPLVSRPVLYALRLAPVHVGEASYYAPQFHGRLQADGEQHDQRRLTAASNAIAMGLHIRVCREDRPWRCVEVEVTDTGELYGRLIDLSRAAAGRLGMMTEGVVTINATVRRD